MASQLDKLHWEGIRGGPNFLTWFREHVNPDLTSDLSVICIIFNHLTYLIGSQWVLASNVHADIRRQCTTSQGLRRPKEGSVMTRSTILKISEDRDMLPKE
jgi:hypothetical protein